jgi:hypothetical protein
VPAQGREIDGTENAIKKRGMRIAVTRRSRGILPNITTPKGGSFIGITLVTVRAWRS